MQEQLARVVLVPARPLDPAECLEPGVAHPGEGGGQPADLIPDRLGIRLAPAGTHPVCEVEHDGEVVPGSRRRLDRLADPLDAPLGIGDGPLRFGPGRGGRQDHVSKRSGPGQEQVLDDEEVEVREEMDRPLLVRLRLDGVLADAVDRGQVASLHRIEHPGQMPAALRRHRHAPGGVERRPQCVVLDVLEPGQAVGQGAHVATALDVVLAAQRVDAAAIAADVPGQQDERDEREDVVDRVVVLGDPERPAQDRAGRGGERVGQIPDRFG